MAENYFANSSERWARFVVKLENAFQVPKGKGKLVRPRYPRKLAGVCSGLAEYFGWNVVLLRVLVVGLTGASTGLMIVAYASAWVLIPEGQYSLSENSSGQAGTSPL